MIIKEKIKKLITIIVGFNIIAVIVYLYFRGCPKSPLDLLEYNATFSLISITITVFINYYLWKTPFIKIFFGNIPNINGKWNATIINEKDKIKQEAILNIRQTWLTTQVITRVERGNSTTITSELIKTNDIWKLYFIWYASHDGIVFNGTTIIDIIDDTLLDGYYFTNSNIDGSKCTLGTFIARKINE